MASPITMQCVVCDGRGCKECGNVGNQDLTGCPKEQVTSDIWELLDYADMYKKGLPPVQGGVLDQAFSFVQACRFVWYVEEYVKKKLGWLE